MTTPFSINNTINTHPLCIGGVSTAAASLAAASTALFAAFYILQPSWIATHTSYVLISTSAAATFISAAFVGYVVYQCKKSQKARIEFCSFEKQKTDIQNYIHSNFPNINRKIEKIYIYEYYKRSDRQTLFCDSEMEAEIGKYPENRENCLLIVALSGPIAGEVKGSYEGYGLKTIFVAKDDTENLRQGLFSETFLDQLTELEKELI